MNPKLVRPLLALSALRLNESEISELLHYTRTISVGNFLRALRQIQENSWHVIDDTDLDYERQHHSNTSMHADVTKAALTLLRDEARLTNDEITKGLESVFSHDETTRSTSIPRFVARKSLSDWLSAVSERVGPSKLLQAATQLRNERVHDKKITWGLGTKSK